MRLQSPDGTNVTVEDEDIVARLLGQAWTEVKEAAPKAAAAKTTTAKTAEK